MSDDADAGTDAMVWTLIEPGVAIVATSLATIRPLLRAMGIRGFQATEHSNQALGVSGTHNNNNNNHTGVRTNQSAKRGGYGSATGTSTDIELGDAQSGDSGHGGDGGGGNGGANGGGCGGKDKNKSKRGELRPPERQSAQSAARRSFRKKKEVMSAASGGGVCGREM